MIQILRETHEASAELQARLARAGGVNRYGEENFRVVWGWSRLAWIGGKWTDTDASGNVIRQRIEREDGILIPALGPYPRRGEYEHCFTLQGACGEFGSAVASDLRGNCARG